MVIEDTCQFNAQILSKGKQDKSDGWKMEFDWKLPGSGYNFIMYGKDWGPVDGWNYGDCPTVTIERGNLKNGKKGEYTSDFFWNLREIADADAAHMLPAPESTQASRAPILNIDVPAMEEQRNRKIAWNSAVNNAVHLIGAWESPEEDPEYIIHRLACKIYQIIIAGPPAAMPQEAPEMPVQPPEQDEPPQRPGERDEAPGFERCSIPTHNGAALLAITGSNRKGHPFMNAGKQREMCYG